MYEKWIKTVKKYIQQVEGLDPKDRLEKVSAIFKCNKAVADSVVGWMNWISQPQLLAEFTEEELSEILTEFKEIAVMFLKFDVKWTETFSKGKADSKKKDSYVT